jgi:hypothetical protein
MESAKDRLRALDREFNKPGATMHLDDYVERRRILSAEASNEAADEREHAAALAAAPVLTVTAAKKPMASEDLGNVPVRWKLLEPLVKAITDQIRAGAARAAKLERRHESTDELIADLEARIAALERK